MQIPPQHHLNTVLNTTSTPLCVLPHPSQVSAALYVKFVPGALKNNLIVGDADLKFCDDKLGQVSRSFAAVIHQLPNDLSWDILIFYLVLRALDTIEDDMTAFLSNPQVHRFASDASLLVSMRAYRRVGPPTRRVAHALIKGWELPSRAARQTARPSGRERACVACIQLQAKCDHLIAFGKKYLGDESWSMDGVGEGAEKELLQGFGAVSRVFNKLPAGSQDVIRDITIKMGQGMADYASVDLGQGTVDMAAYAEYCHMVAGLVGEGLTRSFLERKLESPEIAGQGELGGPSARRALCC